MSGSSETLKILQMPEVASAGNATRKSFKPDISDPRLWTLNIRGSNGIPTSAAPSTLFASTEEVSRFEAI